MAAPNTSEGQISEAISKTDDLHAVSDEGSEALPKESAGSPKGEECGQPHEGDNLTAGSEHQVEHLPEEPVFDGTEKTDASELIEGTVEEGSRDFINSGSGGNEEASRYGAFDFAKRGVDWPEKATALKNFVRERSMVVSSVIRRLSGKKEDLDPLASEKGVEETGSDGLKEKSNPEKESGDRKAWPSLNFRRIGGDTTVEAKADGLPPADDNEGPKMQGRITLFSMSGCQDSRAARCLLRKKGLTFIEINVDVFPQRRLELEERTGTSSVPQIFFNESFVGGIDELNALDATGELNERLKEVFENECPATAPLPPVYGEDEPQSGKLDEFAEVIRKLREKVQIKDRFHKMRLFSRCFVGLDAVEFLAEDQYCERDEAVEFGRKLVAKHFFRHVLQENVFEDGNNLYRFLEHDPIISTKCFNFTGLTNDMEPRPVAEIGTNLRKLTLAIYESYVSDDGKHVDYHSISLSEEFRRYVKLTEDLHRVDLHEVSREEKLSLFINLYNIMAIHAVILFGHPMGPLDRRRFFGEFQYVVGGYPYSLSAIQNGVLRGNQRPPYNLVKPFGPKDKRSLVSLSEVEPLIHFALTSASRSSPAIRCYSPSAIDAELRSATRSFFGDGGVVIDLETKTVSLSKILKWYSVDFGKNELEILKWIVKYLEPNKAEELLQLLDGSQIKVVYQPYDWAPNL